ncbi:MAG: hypothetical protein H7123_07610 [Thermoleophilia bacterium]|nr:hypothetical protein [Thermoleophilia bacterium]
MSRKPSAQLTGTLVIAGVDIARHIIRARAAREQRHEHDLDQLAARFIERASGTASRARERSRDVAVDALSHAPKGVRERLPWPHPRPWHEEHRVLLMLPLMGGALVALLAIAVSATRRMAGSPPVLDRVHEATASARELASDQSRVAAAVTATAAATTAAVDAVATDTSAAAAVGKAATKQVVDEKITQPVVTKAKKYGVLGVLGITAYIVVLAVIVQLIVTQLS